MSCDTVASESYKNQASQHCKQHTSRWWCGGIWFTWTGWELPQFCTKRKSSKKLQIVFYTRYTHQKKVQYWSQQKIFFVSFRFGFYGNIFYDTFDIHQECEIIYESLRYHIIVLVHIEMNIELLKLCEDHTLNPSVYRYILFSREIAIC